MKLRSAIGLIIMALMLFLGGCMSLPTFQQPDASGDYRASTHDVWSVSDYGEHTVKAAQEDFLGPDGKMYKRYLQEDAVIGYEPILNPAGTKVIAQKPIIGKKYRLPIERVLNTGEQRPKTALDVIQSGLTTIAYATGMFWGFDALKSFGNRETQVLTTPPAQIVEKPEVVFANPNF